MKSLTDSGYKVWKTENDEYGTTKHWQARIDTREEFDQSIPLCQLNDKLFINAQEWETNFHGNKNHTFSFDICHENKEGQWCELGIYGLKPEYVKDNLSAIESKLIKMWIAFNE